MGEVDLDAAIRRWDLYGIPHANGAWSGVGEERYTCLYGGDTTPCTLIEDPAGDHLGWIDAGGSVPKMVQHERIFEIQFPYGSAPEVERGRGEIVRVRVVARELGVTQ